MQPDDLGLRQLELPSAIPQLLTDPDRLEGTHRKLGIRSHPKLGVTMGIQRGTWERKRRETPDVSNATRA